MDGGIVMRREDIEDLIESMDHGDPEDLYFGFMDHIEMVDTLDEAREMEEKIHEYITNNYPDFNEFLKSRRCVEDIKNSEAYSKVLRETLKSLPPPPPFPVLSS